MRALTTTAAFLACAAGLGIVAAHLARRRQSTAAMEQPQGKIDEVKAIYARAKVKLEELRRERLAIVERFARRADELRIEEEGKKLREL